MAVLVISSLADHTILTPYHHDAPGSNGEITRVVIHGTVSPCVSGGAVNNAHYFENAKAGGAAHYIVDPTTIVCAVDESCKAAHAPPNAHSIGVELCDPQAGDSARWNDEPHLWMLQRAGALVADICARYSLPLVYLSTSDLLAGHHGITGHVNVAQAWHQSDHTDPRDMPIDVLMRFVSPPPPIVHQEDEELMNTDTLPDGTIVVTVIGTDDGVWFSERKPGQDWSVWRSLPKAIVRK